VSGGETKKCFGDVVGLEGEPGEQRFVRETGTERDAARGGLGICIPK
jgi:hypothetical protein